MEDGREILGTSLFQTSIYVYVTSWSQSSEKKKHVDRLGTERDVSWLYLGTTLRNTTRTALFHFFLITFSVKIGKCSPGSAPEAATVYKIFLSPSIGAVSRSLKLTCMCYWGHTYTVVFANICHVPVLLWSASYKNKWLSIVHLFPLASILLNSSLDVKNPLMSWQKPWYAPSPFRLLAACCTRDVVLLSWNDARILKNGFWI